MGAVSTPLTFNPQVISGCEWGNMLLWEGGLIKVEICRRGRRSCHNGSINQFVLDEGELITIGADGYVRVSTKYVFRILPDLF